LFVLIPVINNKIRRNTQRCKTRRRAYKVIQPILQTNRVCLLLYFKTTKCQSTFVCVVYLITLVVQTTTQKRIIWWLWMGKDAEGIVG